ncbi:hypothetical protein Tco_0382511 [Tanacetum coccineum]
MLKIPSSAKLKLRLVNVEADHAQVNNGSADVTKINFKKVGGDKKWADFFPEWVDENGKWGPMKCPEIPMPESSYEKVDVVVAQLYSKLTEIERDLEAGLGSSALHSRRKEMLLKLRDIEHVESLDAYQKAKIKWGIEADENTKFFHVDFEKALDSVSGDFLDRVKALSWVIGVSMEEVVGFEGWPKKSVCKAFVSNLMLMLEDAIDVGLLSWSSSSNMSRIKEWNPIIEKFKRRLSKWKANMLSIGGRSTLITSVLGSLGVYYLSLFPMPKQINRRLESLRANFFWGCTDAGSVFFHQCGGSGTWSRIVGAINGMHDKGIIPHSSIKRQVKDGPATRFLERCLA